MKLLTKKTLIGLVACLATQSVLADVLLKNFPVQKQDYDNWCWAATSHAVLNFMQKIDATKVKECDIANWAKSADNACKGLADTEINNHDLHLSWNNAVNTSNALYFDKDDQDRGIWGIMNHWKVKGTTYNDFLGWASVKFSIDKGRPFFIRIGYTNGGGHFMLGTGYLVVDKIVGGYYRINPRTYRLEWIDNHVYENWMRVMDPWEGHVNMKFDEVVSNSNYKWTHSMEVE